MSYLKNYLIQAYRFATHPLRKMTMASLKRRQAIPVTVLFYHRVANEYPNDWTISTTSFQKQVDWLQKNFDLVSLPEAQRRIRTGNTRPTVSITFDDGYADNCNFALPMLIERNIPVTYFVTTHHTTHNKPFPHDVESQHALPTNSIESIRALANAGVEIGGHTRTHLDLGQCNDASLLYDEVISATIEMESLVGCSIKYFAFPFGQEKNLNPRVFKLLADHGFAGACSAYGGTNEIFGDEFHLQRIHGDPIFERMVNWLTGDPRLRYVKRYDWQDELKKTTGQSSENCHSPGKFTQESLR